MQEALISDIHGNIDALEAVFADIQSRGIQSIYCLGDVIGYGSNPEECIDLVTEKCAFSLLGNHEWAVLNEPVGFNKTAAAAVNYHKKILKPGMFGSAKKKRWSFIKSVQMKHELGNYTFVHGSPTSPVEEYILRTDVDPVLGEYTQKIVLAFDNTQFVSFFGHTHTPGIVTLDAKWIASGIMHTPFQFVKDSKYLVNIGSVGQPRDGDWRACYAIIDREANTVQYSRVEYDVDKAMNRILEIEELDDELGKRLRRGT